jgi:hypothetical protein
MRAAPAAGQAAGDHYFHRLNAASHEVIWIHQCLRAGRAPVRHGRAQRLLICDGHRGLASTPGVVGSESGGGSAIAGSILAAARVLNYRGVAGSASDALVQVASPGRAPGRPRGASAANVFVSIRGDAIRVSPHVYNAEADVSQFLAALGACGQ